MTEPIKTKSAYRPNDIKPGPTDTQGLMAIFYWKDRPNKKAGFKEYYYGQKIPPEYLTNDNPQKFCDKYAYLRIEKQMEKKKGLWDIMEIIDIATDIKLEQHFMTARGYRDKKVFVRYEWELISHRDQRYKIKVTTAPPPIIKKHFIIS